ncbi:MAG: YchJ family metal-binding protein [Mariprofundaceae bacterium]
MSLCPCGSGEPLEPCCGRFINGKALAPTAEALMRSRYSAYVLGDHDYLTKTWHPETCPEYLGGTALTWLALDIVNTQKGHETDSEGVVAFIASFFDGSKGKRLHETSRFVRANCAKEIGRWLYVDGQCSVSDIGKNDICPCGSDKKFKRCCGSVH